MKKIITTTIATALLSTGLMAAEDNNTMTSTLQAAVGSVYSTFSKNDYRAEYSIGAGYANLDGSGKTSFMFDANPVASKKDAAIYWNFSSEVGENHFELSEKVFTSALGVVDPFFGFGYSRTNIETKKDMGYMFEAQTASTIRERGGFASAGIGGYKNFGSVDATYELGYRFGAVDGWMANVAITNTYGPYFFAHKIGFKIGYEQFRNNEKDFNRKTAYLTYTF